MTSTQPGCAPAAAGRPRRRRGRAARGRAAPGRTSASAASRSADRPPRAQVTSWPCAARLGVQQRCRSSRRPRPPAAGPPAQRTDRPAAHRLLAQITARLPMAPTMPVSTAPSTASTTSTTNTAAVFELRNPAAAVDAGRFAGRNLPARSLPGSAGSPPAGIGGDRGADVPGGDRRRARPGRDRAVPGLQPRAQRAAAGAGRRALGDRPGRVRAGVAVPGVHRRAARRHRAGAAGLLPAPTGCGSSAACSPRCGTAGWPRRTSGWPGCSCWPRSRSGSPAYCWSTRSAPCSAARPRPRCS